MLSKDDTSFTVSVPNEGEGRRCIRIGGHYGKIEAAKERLLLPGVIFQLAEASTSTDVPVS